MDKHYEWASLCQKLNKRESKLFFKEREVWWCYWGQNLGKEQSGGIDFKRPAIILKKINKDLFIGVPLTSKYNFESYKIPIGSVGKEKSFALIEQLKVLSSNRLIDKIDFLPQVYFRRIKVLVKNIF